MRLKIETRAHGSDDSAWQIKAIHTEVRPSNYGSAGSLIHAFIDHAVIGASIVFPGGNPIDSDPRDYRYTLIPDAVKRMVIRQTITTKGTKDRRDFPADTVMHPFMFDFNAFATSNPGMAVTFSFGASTHWRYELVEVEVEDE